MKWKIVIGGGIVAAVFLILAGIKASQISKMISAGKNGQPPATIASATAREEKWVDTLTAVGSVTAEQGVTVAPEIAGKVSTIDFESGQDVKKGDLLLKLDTSSEAAQLRAAEAQVELSKLTAERTRKLRADKTISQSELDNAVATLKENEANADAIRATIAKKTIRAPFSGQLGIRQVNLGESLSVGQSIVSLQSLTPVYVDFSLPQQDLEHLKTGLKVNVTADAYPGKEFTGDLTAINPDLDTATRSVRLRAKFANTNKLLHPGMFVRVEVELPGEDKVLAIPQTAVLSAPYGDAVYLIESHLTNGVTNLVVHQKFIRTGRARGDFISVESGLKAGDQVVSAGLFKLHNGDHVHINNTDTPKPSLSPNPPNS